MLKKIQTGIMPASVEVPELFQANIHLIFHALTGGVTAF